MEQKIKLVLTMDFKAFKEKYVKKPVEHYPNNVPDDPVVSVCVQTYQHVDYIKDCLEGILMQKTDFPFEILLGEDNSSDGTREICIDYAKTYPDKIRLFLHHRENNLVISGRPTGRFNGVYNRYSAKGKYIALCEGDDYWTDPYKLQKQVDFLEQNKDCSLCSHSYKIKYIQEKKPDLINGGGIKGTIKFSVEDIIGGKYLRTVTLLFRSLCVKDIPEWTSKAPLGDRPLLMICATFGKAGFIGGEPMAVYRRGVTGAWSEQKSNKDDWALKRLEQQIKCMDLFNEYTAKKYNAIIQRKKRKWIIDHLSSLETQLNRRKTLQLFRDHQPLPFIVGLNKREMLFWIHVLVGVENYSLLRQYLK